MTRIRFLLYLSAGLVVALMILGVFSPRWLRTRLRLLRLLGFAYVGVVAALAVSDVIRRLFS